MASQFYVPGPAQVYVAVGASSAYLFLGWSDNGVEGQLLSSYDDVQADFAGNMVPADVQWMGEQAFVPMVLTRYVESVLKTCLGRRVGSGVAAAGSMEANALGSLMVGQGYAYGLCIVAPYQVLTPFTTMVPCYTFSAAWLHDDANIPTSVRVKRPRITFRSIPIWNPVSATYVLYTNTLPTLPAVS